jgi:DNA-directed RNA polymerase II subunit RPB2
MYIIQMICEKGTIGLTLSQSNMPFSEEGISPDLIINPQGIPSRMCVGHLLECLFGKAGAILGMEVDGTSFNDIDIEKVKDILESHGYERNATEYLYNGMTGQKMHVPIYIGPTYYQRLKHLVMDKMHSRSRGPITMLTHQPPEGENYCPCICVKDICKYYIN